MPGLHQNYFKCDGQHMMLCYCEVGLSLLLCIIGITSAPECFLTFLEISLYKWEIYAPLPSVSALLQRREDQNNFKMVVSVLVYIYKNIYLTRNKIKTSFNRVTCERSHPGENKKFDKTPKLISSLIFVSWLHQGSEG